MAMLSYSRGRPIAKIIGGQNDGKIIHIYEPDNDKVCCLKCSESCNKKKCCKKCEVKTGGCLTCDKHGGDMDPDIIEDDPMSVLTRDFLNKRKKLSGTNLDKLRTSLQKEEEPQDNAIINELYHDALRILKNKNRHEIILYGGRIVPLPNKKNREISYVSAPSGAGKSTYAAEYMKQYQDIFPHNPIYVFSRLDTDKALDGIKHIKRILINAELINDPIDPIKELNDCCVLFDDIDTIYDDNIKKEIQKLRADILEIGRHPSTYCIATSHMLMNYKETRVLLSESHLVTFFPEATPRFHIDRFLKVYAGLTNPQIKKICSFPSRWVTISNRYPKYVLHEKGVYLINNKD